MSVTQRLSIQWGQSPSSEPTDTLVITSPEGHFVDVRALKNHEPHDKFPIEWAFCGRTEQVGDGKVNYSHDIDSRQLQGEPVDPDVGSVETLANGDEREEGEMTNPATGKVESYVEVWRPLDPNKETRTPLPKSLVSDVNVSVLATVDGQKMNGRVVRVGRWIQGILEFDDDNDKTGSIVDRLAIVRAKSTGDIWSKEVSIGKHADKVPVSDLEGRVLGDTFIYGGIEWAVIEHRRSRTDSIY